MCEAPPIPRGVKPRTNYEHSLPMIAATRDGIAYSDHTGEVAPIAEIVADHPRAMVVTPDALNLLLSLHFIYAENERWNFRITPVQREKLSNNKAVETYVDNLVNFFGFMPEGRSQRTRRYFYPICPSQFCRLSLGDLIPDEPDPLWKLYQWGQQVREFVVDNGLRFSATSGGLAAQLLRDSRFYPSPRRKVPTATNEKMRKNLPGNYYELHAATDRIYAGAFYIDQENAHHYAAQTVDLPRSDELRAAGFFYDDCLEEPEGWDWINRKECGEEYWDWTWRNWYGIYYCHITVPRHVANQRYIHPICYTSGDKFAYIYTNEYDYLVGLGVQFHYIVAGWTSHHKDKGIAQYSKWAQRQVKEHPEWKPWLKTVLLSSYGILATKPRQLKTGYYRSNSGEDEYYYIGPERLTLKSKSTKKPLQSGIANVIQRGMIEAETRKLSLSLARDLEKQGYEVFAIHADALLVRDTGGKNSQVHLPLLPAPWRIKRRLSMVRFHDPQSFEADLMRKMPGRRRKASPAMIPTETRNPLKDRSP